MTFSELPAGSVMRSSCLAVGVAITTSSLLGCEMDSGSGEAGGGQVVEPTEVSVLAELQDGPTALVVNEGVVYWAARGATPGEGVIMRLSLQDGEPTAVAQHQDPPESLAVDPGGISWTTHGPSGSGGLFRTGLAGGPVLGLASLEPTRGLAAAGGELFWTGSDDGTVERVSAKGGLSSVFADGQLAPGPIAISGESIYWGTEVGIVHAVLSASASPELAWQGEAPLSIAVSSAAIAWSTRTGDVYAADLGVAQPTLLSSGDESAPFTRAVAVDERNVYYADIPSGSVVSVPLGGGPLTILATGQQQPVAIAVDGPFVYWVDFLAGTVMRATKGG